MIVTGKSIYEPNPERFDRVERDITNRMVFMSGLFQLMTPEEQERHFKLELMSVAFGFKPNTKKRRKK